MTNVTVIIPHKNSFKSLLNLLDCIPDSMQVIVVDDKSDSETQNQLKSVTRPNLTLVFNQYDESNAGFSRNLGIKALNDECEWVMFADADDLMNIVNLEKLVDHLDSERADVVLAKVNARMDNGEPSARADYIQKLLNEYPENKDEILFKWVGPIAKIVRKTLIEQHQLKFESRIASNDVVYSARLAALKPTINVFKHNIYTILQNKTSLTATLTLEKAKSRLEALWMRNEIFSKVSHHTRLAYGTSNYKFICLNGTIGDIFQYLPGMLKNLILASKVNIRRLFKLIK